MKKPMEDLLKLMQEGVPFEDAYKRLGIAQATAYRYHAKLAELGHVAHRAKEVRDPVKTLKIAEDARRFGPTFAAEQHNVSVSTAAYAAKMPRHVQVIQEQARRRGFFTPSQSDAFGIPREDVIYLQDWLKSEDLQIRTHEWEAGETPEHPPCILLWPSEIDRRLERYMALSFEDLLALYENPLIWWLTHMDEYHRQTMLKIPEIPHVAAALNRHGFALTRPYAEGWEDEPDQRWHSWTLTHLASGRTLFMPYPTNWNYLSEIVMSPNRFLRDALWREKEKWKAPAP